MLKELYDTYMIIYLIFHIEKYVLSRENFTIETTKKVVDVAFFCTLLKKCLF